MQKFKTEIVNKLQNSLLDLEILNQRVLHLNSEQYTIESGLVVTKELTDLRYNINTLLKKIDNELFYYEDDGR